MPPIPNSIESNKRDGTPSPDVLEPIALIGFALKFPQDADTPQGFWKVMVEKRDVMTEWPADRLNMGAFYCRDDNRPGQSFVPGAHFLKEDLGVFDAPFFGISATEAAAIDPQHRNLLETTYHALENAGLRMEQVSGSNTGVYSGSMTDDYKYIITKDVDRLHKYTATGVPINMTANRVSWFYNFLGPSVNMDSACSSSLMAFDFACQGLRNRDCNMAVVTGSSMVLAAEGVLSLTNLGFLSPHGRCFSFDERADGYSRGEGFSAVILKRLSDALADGDSIRAVVRSTGSNQDGHTPGITQPSSKSQATLIRETYRKAGLGLEETRFFEAHGTGTSLGDPIEASAIGTTFRGVRSPEEPLYIGALKSNIGHLEGGSGLAGVIKATMVLEKGIIPPNANFEKANDSIDWEFLNIRFPTQCIPWPSHGLRRASVASFGFGGSNSHAILDDSHYFLTSRGLDGHHCTTVTSSLDHQNHVNGASNGYQNGSTASKSSHSSSSHTGIPRLLLFSAHDHDGLKRLAEVYKAHFQTISREHQSRQTNGNSSSSAISRQYLDSLAYTLSEKRSVLRCRSFAVVSSLEDLQNLPALISKPAVTPNLASSSRGTAFVFTGQGAQYQRMGAGLLPHPVFRTWIDRFDQALAQLGCGWSVVNILAGQEANELDEPEYSQPTTTALQIALYELLQSVGLRTGVVLGHSSGEIAAAYAAGFLTLESACKVSYFRGKLSTSLKRSKFGTTGGAMMSVDMQDAEMRSYMGTVSKCSVSIACVNSPGNVTISGADADIDFINTELQSRGVRTRKLNTGVAYHSPFMQEIAEQYASSISGIHGVLGNKLQRPKMISSVTGTWVESTPEAETEAIVTLAPSRPDYWVTNMVSPVLFSQAMATIAPLTQKNLPTRQLGQSKLDPLTDIIEIGPHSALRRPILDCLSQVRVAQHPHASNQHQQNSHIRYHSVLIRQEKADYAFLQLIGDLFTRGYSLDVQKANEINNHLTNAKPQMLVDLPSYPFNHTKRYWYESSLSRHGRIRRHDKHELLGVPAADWNPLEPRWRKVFDLTETPWIEHHKVNGKTIYPATGMVVMAIQAAAQLAEDHIRENPNKTVSGYEIRDAVFSSPIVIEEESNVTSEAWLHLRPDRSTTDKTADGFEYRLYSATGSNQDAADDAWLEHSSGIIRVIYDKGPEDNQQQSHIHKERTEEDVYYHTRLLSAQESCTLKVLTIDMYANFAANGLAYGPSFRALDELAWDGGNQAVGILRCDTWLASKDAQRRYKPHVAHPVTLDAAGQLMWVALTKGAREVVVNGAAVTRIRNAWISSTGCCHLDTSFLRAACTTGLRGLRGTNSSMFALDPEGHLRLRISGIETTAVGGDETALLAPEKGTRELCFEMSYKPDIDLLKPGELLALTAVDSLPDYETNAEAFYGNLELALYCSVAKTLDFLSTLDHDISTTSPPHISKYIAWLRRQHGIFQPKYSSSPILQDPQALENLLDRLESANAEGRLLVQISRHLPEIITGKVQPLELLFGTDSGPSLAENFYAEVCDKTRCCKGLAPYLDALAHKNPQLKILEVGAGTGSITKHVLLDALRLYPDDNTVNNTVPRFARYDYTDISPAYFEAARAKFCSQDPQIEQRMRFKVLDIEAPILSNQQEKGGVVVEGSEQEELEESYDLIIAAWVLHATRDLAKTVRNVRRLLKPGGKLVMLEITAGPDSLRSAVAFGTLPGWWLGGSSDATDKPDRDGVDEQRKWSPCVDETTWNRILMENGFKGGVDVVIRDYDSPACCESSILIATATEEDAAAADTVPDAEITVVLDTNSPLQVEFGNQFQALLRQGPGTNSKIFNLLSLQDHAATGSGAPQKMDIKTLVFLAELNTSLLARLDKSSFEALQTLLTAARHHVIWVSSSSQSSPATATAETHLIRGLSRVLNTERPNRPFVTLHFDEPITPENLGNSVRQLHRVLSRTIKTTTSPTNIGSSSNTHPTPELEYILPASGLLSIPRVFPSPHLNTAIHARCHPSLKPRRPPSVSQSQTSQSIIPLCLKIPNPGLLDSLRFVPDPLHSSNTPLDAQEIEIRVQAVGVNFRDLLVCLGKLPATTIGCECAGTVTRVGADFCPEKAGYRVGDRVAAVVLGCVSTFARCHSSLAVRIPEGGLTSTEAAGLAVTGVTAYLALVKLANLKPGESVLIHSTAGGTGQMALQLAISLLGGRTDNIYATVGAPEKRNLLTQRYGLREENIFHSRDTSFRGGVLRATNSRGVDVVLNSLSGEGLAASWGCIAPFGRFVEIGRTDMEANSKLGMGRFAQNVSFHGLALDHLVLERPDVVGEALREVMKMVEEGKLRTAYPLEVCKMGDVETAFRRMQTGRNTGKMVLEWAAGGEDVPTWLEPRHTTTLRGREDGTYLIAGGLGGLGRSAARWMAQRGAKNLVLLSRSGPETRPAAVALLAELREEFGVRVKTCRCDVSSAESVRAALDECAAEGMPPIRGVLQCTMVLQDSLFENMTYEQWEMTTRSKVDSTRNLHHLLVAEPDEEVAALDFFVMLSSSAGIVGTMGQANYAAGNTYQDGLASASLRQPNANVRVTSIDLGLMAEIGIVAENGGLAPRGTETIGDLAKVSEKEFLALLDLYCRPLGDDYDDVLETGRVITTQPIIGLVSPEMIRARSSADGAPTPTWLLDRPLLKGLAASSWSDDQQGDVGLKRDAGGRRDWRAEFLQAVLKSPLSSHPDDETNHQGGDGNQAAADAVVEAALVDKLSRVTSIPADEIDPARPLHVYGVDSLLAVELRNWFAREFRADVAIFDISSGQVTLAEVARRAARASELKGQVSLGG